jgi:hypothetical protein
MHLLVNQVLRNITTGLSSLMTVVNKPGNVQIYVRTLFTLLVKLLIESSEKRFNDSYKIGETMHSDEEESDNLNIE